MVAATVEASLAMEVDEVHQQLLADAAREAGGVPDGVGTESGCLDDDVSLGGGLLALQWNRRGRKSQDGFLNYGSSFVHFLQGGEKGRPQEEEMSWWFTFYCSSRGPDS